MTNPGKLYLILQYNISKLIVVGDKDLPKRTINRWK